MVRAAVPPRPRSSPRRRQPRRLVALTLVVPPSNGYVRRLAQPPCAARNGSRPGVVPADYECHPTRPGGQRGTPGNGHGVRINRTSDAQKEKQKTLCIWVAAHCAAEGVRSFGRGGRRPCRPLNAIHTTNRFIASCWPSAIGQSLEAGGGAFSRCLGSSGLPLSANGLTIAVLACVWIVRTRWKYRPNANRSPRPAC